MEVINVIIIIMAVAYNKSSIMQKKLLVIA